MELSDAEKQTLEDIESALAAEDHGWAEQFTCACPSHRPRRRPTLAFLCASAVAVLAVVGIVLAANSAVPALAALPALVWAASGVVCIRLCRGKDS